MIKQFGLSALELMLNQGLKLETDLYTLMQPLQGHTLGIEIKDWNLRMLIVPNAESFSLYCLEENEASATLSGKLAGFIQLAQSQTPQADMATGAVQLSGNAHTLSAYQLFAQQIHLDWELVLTEWVGHSAASIITKPFKSLCGVITQNRGKMRADIGEYLQEEARLTPPKQELEDWFDDITRFRQSVDRFEAKLKGQQS